MKSGDWFIAALVLCILFFSCKRAGRDGLTPEERLGKSLFFHAALSFPEGQSCATCHRPERGFADSLGREVSEGIAGGLFGMRNSMTISYAAFVPALTYDAAEETYIGGLFWDGRVNSLVEQAAEPFTNPLEMGAERRWVVEQTRKSRYFEELIRLYGPSENVDTLYGYITRAIAAYEQSAEVCPFSSKFDAWMEGKAELSEMELKGMDLFKDKGMCAECHVMEEDPRAGKILFTDHTYDNLGIPRNDGLLFYTMENEYGPCGRDTIDRGLGGFLGDSLHYGKFRVPTLRNIALTAPYGHNGYFATLEDIVHFYNVRDVSDEYPEPEYNATVNSEELGDLKLTPEEEAALVAFMKTLTDGYKAE